MDELVESKMSLEEINSLARHEAFLLLDNAKSLTIITTTSTHNRSHLFTAVAFWGTPVLVH